MELGTNFCSGNTYRIDRKAMASVYRIHNIAQDKFPEQYCLRVYPADGAWILYSLNLY